MVIIERVLAVDVLVDVEVKEEVEIIKVVVGVEDDVLVVVGDSSRSAVVLPEEGGVAWARPVDDGIE